MLFVLQPLLNCVSSVQLNFICMVVAHRFRYLMKAWMHLLSVECVFINVLMVFLLFENNFQVLSCKASFCFRSCTTVYWQLQCGQQGLSQPGCRRGGTILLLHALFFFLTSETYLSVWFFAFLVPTNHVANRVPLADARMSTGLPICGGSFKGSVAEVPAARGLWRSPRPLGHSRSSQQGPGSNEAGTLWDSSW